ncbi:MAG: hypothetical protein DUD34_02860 [Lactobacillus sp.]|nr:MAG: hypothetical protein DUD34_02860 [Lactobacillus sp.]
MHVKRATAAESVVERKQLNGPQRVLLKVTSTKKRQTYVSCRERASALLRVMTVFFVIKLRWYRGKSVLKQIKSLFWADFFI